jgi:hypothetical protein
MRISAKADYAVRAGSLLKIGGWPVRLVDGDIITCVPRRPSAIPVIRQEAPGVGRALAELPGKFLPNDLATTSLVSLIKSPFRVIGVRRNDRDRSTPLSEIQKFTTPPAMDVRPRPCPER